MQTIDVLQCMSTIAVHRATTTAIGMRAAHRGATPSSTASVPPDIATRVPIRISVPDESAFLVRNRNLPSAITHKMTATFLVIPECDNPSLNDCDSPDRAICTDTDEGYLCRCRQGFLDISPDTARKPGRLCKPRKLMIFSRPSKNIKSVDL